MFIFIFSFCCAFFPAIFGAVGVVISEEEGRRHRIAFNSLYLFSFRSINYEANGEALYDSRVEQLVSSSYRFRERPVSGAYLFAVHARKHPGGVASMTRDKGYPDWLVLSAAILWPG